MKIIVNEILNHNSFVEEKTDKENIILQNCFFDLKKFDCKDKIHYLIDKEGIVYQILDPDCWFDNFFIDKKNINRKSIVIGLMNEGKLQKKNDGKFYYRNRVVVEYKEPVFESEENWREGKYFATYKESQLVSLMNLLNYLFDRFPKIDKFFSNSLDYNEKWYSVKGITLKCNLLKTAPDITPAFPIERFNRYILKIAREEIVNMTKVFVIEFISIKEHLRKKK